MPDELHKALKERARQNRRSVNQEVIAELSKMATEAVEIAKKQRVLEVLALAEQLREELQQTLSVEEIQTAIEDRRR